MSHAHLHMVLIVLPTGLGCHCQELCANMAGYCAVEHHKALYTLMAYEHLARVYPYCFAHFVQNITRMRGQIPTPVRNAMMNLALAEPLRDFKGTLDLIRTGGKK